MTPMSPGDAESHGTGPGVADKQPANGGTEKRYISQDLMAGDLSDLEDTYGSLQTMNRICHRA